MKGLLLKDFYMIGKYCRSFVLILTVFLVVSCFGNDNTFFIIYPVLIAGMIPVTLISYDEREKWHIYSETLPYTRAQFVSVKYLIGLLFELTVFLLSAAAQA
ncbi:MAG: ABC-2 transporter permease [Clostridiales bacterium]|nr:ABC-2 transporter permease [Clostridiales bacterium]